MVTAPEAAVLLAHASEYDKRKEDKHLTRAWSIALADIDFTDAMTAIDHHYARSNQWIMPADVAAGVRTIESERIAAAPNVYELEPPSWVRDKEGPEGDAAYLEWIQRTTQQIRRGQAFETGTRPPAVDDPKRLRELVASVRVAHRAS